MSNLPTEAIPFESRVGAWEFHEPALAMAYAGQVMRWAQISHIQLYFDYKKIGSDHIPCWMAVPIVDGERLDSKYFGYDGTKDKAKEMACRKMAFSGHC
ncbi:hypothetical protein FRC08_018457 [Ceratobasidium sp. 394]|nr:hypothetical protein FRC08_018457 [Ceratobasidium sp. 394]